MLTKISPTHKEKHYLLPHMWKQYKKREIENYPKVDKWLSEPGEGC